MNELDSRIQKVSMPRFEPQKWDLQFGSGPGASRSLGSSKNNENIRNTSKKTSWNVLGHCFVMNEVFWGIQKLSMPRFEAEKWDLQFGTGPGASRSEYGKYIKKQTFCFQKKVAKCKINVNWVGKGRGRLRPVQNNENIRNTKGHTSWDFCFFWDIVLSWMRCFGGFRRSRCHGSKRKNEIYNLGVVPEPPELKKQWKYRKYFKQIEKQIHCCFKKIKNVKPM